MSEFSSMTAVSRGDARRRQAQIKTQRGEVVSRLAHNQEVAGSNPAAASGPGPEKMILLSCSLNSISGPRATAGAFFTLTPARNLPARPGPTRAPGFLSQTHN